METLMRLVYIIGEISVFSEIRLNSRGSESHVNNGFVNI